MMEMMEMMEMNGRVGLLLLVVMSSHESDILVILKLLGDKHQSESNREQTRRMNTNRYSHHGTCCG